MAGDVNKIQPQNRPMMLRAMAGGGGGGAGPVVTEKAFDEFHLYDIARATTLHDHETKQVEFVHAEKMLAPTIYVYDGAEGFRFYGLNYDQGYGRSDNKKILVQREFKNAETNQLGIALPAGKLRFYRRDDGGQLQFVGENTIDHTPRNETVRVTTGNAFDLVGERKQTDFKVSAVDTNARRPHRGLRRPSRSSCATARRSRWKSASSNISTAGTTGKSRPSRTTS